MINSYDAISYDPNPPEYLSNLVYTIFFTYLHNGTIANYLNQGHSVFL